VEHRGIPAWVGVMNDLSVVDGKVRARGETYSRSTMARNRSVERVEVFGFLAKIVLCNYRDLRSI
jgi:hypothetical protein